MTSQSLSQLIHSRWARGNYDVLHISKWDEVPTINIIVLLIHLSIIFIFCQTVQFLLHAPLILFVGSGSFYQDRVLLCSSSGYCPVVHVDQTRLELRNLPASSGTKGMHTITPSCIFSLSEFFTQTTI